MFSQKVLGIPEHISKPNARDTISVSETLPPPCGGLKGRLPGSSGSWYSEPCLRSFQSPHNVCCVSPLRQVTKGGCMCLDSRSCGNSPTLSLCSLHTQSPMLSTFFPRRAGEDVEFIRRSCIIGGNSTVSKPQFLLTVYSVAIHKTLGKQPDWVPLCTLPAVLQLNSIIYL